VVSLLCTLSKALEKAAAIKLVGHRKDNQLLNKKKSVWVSGKNLNNAPLKGIVSRETCIN
jgi:hypothetical protein